MAGIEMTREMLEKIADPIGELNLSVRTSNTLDESGVFTIEELLNCCAKPTHVCDCQRLHLLGISNFGEKTLMEVLVALSRAGFGPMPEGSEEEYGQ